MADERFERFLGRASPLLGTRAAVMGMAILAATMTVAWGAFLATVGLRAEAASEDRLFGALLGLVALLGWSSTLLGWTIRGAARQQARLAAK